MLLTLTWATPKHDVDLYVRSRSESTKGEKMPQPDSSIKQGVYFSGDKMTDSSEGPGTDAWLIRDVQIGGEFEVYYKFMQANGNPAPAFVKSADVNHEGGFWNLPYVQIPKPGTVLFIGVIRFGEDRQLTFTPQPEYAAVFQQLNQKRLSPRPAAK
jgi:hypothetical protein